MFEPKFFWEQMYCIEESTCNITGTSDFWAPPQWFGARGIVPSFPIGYAPGRTSDVMLLFRDMLHSTK